jgi:AcrR family transcriptional regulator
MSRDGARRSYDATSRRKRAEEERRATRTRVVEAATDLFARNGYTGTTMADIAREASVAMQSVYSAGRSKADLLQAAVQRAVAGDDAEVLVHQRPAYAAAAAEPDPARQVHLLADLICDVHERSAPIQAALRQAAAVDDAVARALEDEHRHRLETFRAIVDMLPADRLKHSPEETADTAWAVASAEVFILLRTVREWSWDEIREWLRRTLVDLILDPNALRRS